MEVEQLYHDSLSLHSALEFYQEPIECILVGKITNIILNYLLKFKTTITILHSCSSMRERERERERDGRGEETDTVAQRH